MRNYFSRFRRDTTALDFTGFTVKSQGNTRPAIFYILIATAATPGDTAHQWLVRRFLAAGNGQGTGTDYTPQPLRAGDLPSLANTKHNHTIEPNYDSGKHLLIVPMNQRGTYQWIATRDDRMLESAAVNGDGLGIEGNDNDLAPATPVVAYNGTIHFAE